MVDKKDIKEKIRKIYEVLPKLDDQQCGYKSCGEFARAVAERKAPCYGCVSGGSEVAAKVCQIMEAEVPQETVAQLAPLPRYYHPGLSGDRDMGRGLGRGMSRGLGGGRGMGRGQGMRRGRGMGRSGGMGRGFSRGRLGR